MKIIPVFLPYAGCKTRCIYCNQYIATGTNHIPKPIEVRKFLEKAEEKINEDFLIGFYGGTFLNLPNSVIKYYLGSIPKNELLKGLRLSTTFDSLTREKIDVLKEYFSYFEIEFGLETINIKVQKMANRIIISKDEIMKKVHLCKENNIPFFIHLMSGLPADDDQSFLNSCRFVAQLKPMGVRIHPTIVLKGTKLEKMYKDGEYEPQRLYDAAKLIAKGLPYFISKNIPITRLGLFPDVSLQQEGNVIAGPFHPAFGSIVWSYYYRIILDKKMGIKGDYIIYAHSKIHSYINGFKKINKKYFEKKGIFFIIKSGKRLMVKRRI